MKKLITLALATIATVSAFTAKAQSNIPDYIHLSAVARHTGTVDTPVANAIIEVQVEIWESTSSTSFTAATQYYCELQHNVPTNAHGEFSIDFGDPTYICGSFGAMSSIPWSSGKMWYVLKYDSSTAGILIPIDTGRISTAPYAFASRTAEHLINIGTAPATGSVLSWNGSAWVAGTNPWNDYLLAEDQETSGTNGGASVTGWQTRVLNFTVNSSGTAITRSGNNITLNQVGTYYVKGSAVAEGPNRTQLVIQDLTTSANYIIGMSMFAWNAGTSDSYSCPELEGFITVTTAPLTFVLRQYYQAGLSGSGLGVETGSGVTEVFAKVFVQKIK